jgi:hypothetical protein
LCMCVSRVSHGCGVVVLSRHLGNCWSKVRCNRLHQFHFHARMLHGNRVI